MVKRSDDPSPLEALVQQQAATIQRLDTEVAALKSQASYKVAFTVQFSADPVANVGVHGTLKFDRVITNAGNCYDSHTGEFTAPVSGLYVIFLRAMTNNNQGHIALYVNKAGHVIADLFVEGQPDPWDQGSVEVAVHVQAGEKIWVTHANYDTTLRGGWWTVFTGFLIHAD
nr:hypothetical protein BaRGS_002411 [Batillaria attramentaria]